MTAAEDGLTDTRPCPQPPPHRENMEKGKPQGSSRRAPGPRQAHGRQQRHRGVYLQTRQSGRHSWHCQRGGREDSRYTGVPAPPQPAPGCSPASALPEGPGRGHGGGHRGKGPSLPVMAPMPEEEPHSALEGGHQGAQGQGRPFRSPTPGSSLCPRWQGQQQQQPRAWRHCRPPDLSRSQVQGWHPRPEMLVTRGAPPACWWHW